MRKYSLILFDVDGTIANTDELIVQTFYELYDRYNNGVRKSRDEIYYFSGPPIRKTLKNEFPHYDLDFMYEEFHRISWDNYPKYMTTYPDCIETLKALKKQGYVLGVVTNKLHVTTEYCLRLLNMFDLMDVIIGADDVNNAKPSPDGIIKAMQIVGETDLNKVIYIGDNTSDIKTAQNAQVDCIIATWGPRQIEKTDYVIKYINSYKELKEVLL